MKTNAQFRSRRCILLTMRKVSGKIVEKIKTIFMIKTFFQKLCPLRDSVEKYCRTGQATHENMAHARCMLYT
jgi:hypothetical protein